MRLPPLMSNIAYHIYNRGMSKQKMFKSEIDYFNFMHRIAKYKTKYKIVIMKYCILPNHYHMLIRTKANPKNISLFLKCLQQSYALHFNKKYEQSGHLFQGSYRNKAIDSKRYLKEIIEYIKNNPVKHGLVKKPEDWPYAG